MVLGHPRQASTFAFGRDKILETIQGKRHSFWLTVSGHTVSRDRDVVVLLAGGIWWRCACHQEAKRDEHWCAACFLGFYPVPAPSLGWFYPQLQWIFSPKFTQTRNYPTGTCLLGDSKSYLADNTNYLSL